MKDTIDLLIEEARALGHGTLYSTNVPFWLERLEGTLPADLDIVVFVDRFGLEGICIIKQLEEKK